MYKTNDIGLNVQINLNANKDKIVETNLVTSGLAFNGFILILFFSIATIEVSSSLLLPKS